MQIAYYISVILISLIIFFMEISAPNWLGELILKAGGKILPLFCIVLSCIELCRIFKLLP